MGMIKILLTCDPFQILSRVILLISVNMIDPWLIIWIRGEANCNKPMYYLSFSIYVNGFITTFIHKWTHQFTILFVPDKGLYITKRTGLIAFISGYVFPNFCHS